MTSASDAENLWLTRRSLRFRRIYRPCCLQCSQIVSQMFGGERHLFQDQVVILVDEGDQHALSAFFHLGMIFGWDIDCYTLDGKFEIDHDGSIAFFLVVDDLNLVQSFQSMTSRHLAKSDAEIAIAASSAYPQTSSATPTARRA